MNRKVLKGNKPDEISKDISDHLKHVDDIFYSFGISNFPGKFRETRDAACALMADSILSTHISTLKFIVKFPFGF